jgi:hypothetical protein
MSSQKTVKDCVVIQTKFRSKDVWSSNEFWEHLPLFHTLQYKQQQSTNIVATTKYKHVTAQN